MHSKRLGGDDDVAHPLQGEIRIAELRIEAVPPSARSV